MNLTDDVSELILDIVLQSIFGPDLARLERQLGANPFEVVAKDQNRDLKFAFRFRSLTKLVAELIERRRREPEPHFDFLGMLMDARDRDSGAPMSDKEMIDEVMTLIVAGHETTAAALTWAWYLISQHPQAAEELAAEADRAASPLGLDAAESLPFTHQVLQEALRLYPPGWLFTRRTIEADELGGFPIGPAHRRVHQPLSAAPASGVLERTGGIPAASDLPAPTPQERHQFAYIPFSVGPRHCIGENLAMFEMLVHLHTMTRRFRLMPRGRRTHRTRGADQSAPALQPHDDGDPAMIDKDSASRSWRATAGVDRAVTYIEGENSERRVTYGEVYARALGILYHLQAMGAQRGDKMIIFLNNNEQFLDGFWAAVCGGIVPVPLGVGISDEHRHKLLRVARKIGKPLLYTDAKNLERLAALAAEVGETALFGELKSRCFLVEIHHRHLAPRQAAPAGAGRPGLHSILVRVHQRAEGRHADPRQSHREHRRRNGRAASSASRTCP